MTNKVTTIWYKGQGRRDLLFYKKPLKTKSFTTLQKAKTESLSHINLALQMKKARQRACLISRAEGKCLLAATKRPTTRQKTKTESLSHIKSQEGVPVSSRNKKTYHPTKNRDKEPVPYQEPRENACWPQQKDLPPYKRPRWRACPISKARRECLLAVTERPTTLQKTETKSLSHIKSQEGVLVSRNRKTYHPTKPWDGEPVLYQELKVLPYKRPRQRVCPILRIEGVVIRAGRGILLFLSWGAKGEYLLAATERPTTLQKAETESLSYIKSWRCCNKSRRGQPAVLIKSQGKIEQEPLETKRSTNLQKTIEDRTIFHIKS